MNLTLRLKKTTGFHDDALLLIYLSNPSFIQQPKRGEQARLSSLVTATGGNFLKIGYTLSNWSSTPTLGRETAVVAS